MKGDRDGRHCASGGAARPTVTHPPSCCPAARRQLLSVVPGAAVEMLSFCWRSRSLLRVRRIYGRWPRIPTGSGTEDNAGAIVTPDTLARGERDGLDAGAMLADNDGYSFFKNLGDLVMTGPTLTNVNDFRAILVLPR